MLTHFSIILTVGLVSTWFGVDSTEADQYALNTNNHMSCEGLTGRRYYTAGVVEYKPLPIGSHSPVETMLANVEIYVELMESAAEHNVDIIVFPEYGITTVGMPSHRQLAREFLVELPKFGSVPCDDESTATNFQILRRLSCAAKQMRMYTVVNLGELQNCDSSTDEDCPSDGAYHYNTNIVLDRNGSLISRYRKYHLYFEPQFDKPSIEYSTFETDFGVEFGLFTCFDIIFAHPAVELVARKNIRNFAFPTAWVDELPFLTAIQAQSLWAQSNRANLLASGYHQPDRGSMGSGIYSRDRAFNYTFDPTSGTKLVIAEVPIQNDECGEDWRMRLRGNKSPDDDNPPTYHMWLREDLSNYTHKLLDPGLNEDSLCHLDLLCCSFKYNLTLPLDPNFSGFLRLLAFEGRRTVAAKTDSFEWQVCAVVHCLNATLESCTEQETPQNLQLHPKFKTLSIQMQPLTVEEYEEHAAQPALSLIDTDFQLIPPSFFNVRQWKDPQTNTSYVKVMSSSEENLVAANVKTVGVIQRIYGGRK